MAAISVKDKWRHFREKCCRWFLINPVAKTAVTVTFTVVAGLFSNLLASEIFVNGLVTWSKLPTSWFFWIVAFLSYLLFLYHKAEYRFGNDLAKYSDAEYCRAYVKRQCLPELALRYQNSIRNGDTEALIRAKQEMEEFIK